MKYGVYVCYEFVWVEGFLDVVIGIEIEVEYDVVFFVFGCDYDDWNVFGFCFVFECVVNVEIVDFGNYEIEEDEIGVFGSDGVEFFIFGVGGVNVEFFVG